MSARQISIVAWCMLSVIADSVLTAVFTFQLTRIYKVSNGQYNRLTAIIWLLIAASAFHIISATLMAAIHLIIAIN
jgi:hypothetical protein